MKKTVNAVFALLFILALPVYAAAAELLVPVGQVVGLQLGNDTVTVAALDESLAASGGLQVGDQILRIDGSRITCTEDVHRALATSDGTVRIAVQRGDEEVMLTVCPRITADGPRLGVYLRQGVTGIGTVTWYDPDTGTFGSLGHGVSDEYGTLIAMTEGSAYPARVMSVRKGRSGEPGQLVGALQSNDPIAALYRNTPQGVFGEIQEAFTGQAIPTAAAGEVHTGKATILSTVEGTAVREYSVEILKIYPKSRPNGRNMLIKVTDQTLLNTTGGIVQGMSGSPLVQDGKLIGAVTHVLVNDPTMGYGIFIENMLEAAG